MSAHSMSRLRRLVPSPAAEAASTTKDARAIFRRFFALIERFEGPRSEARPAPETKARITRLDDKPHRNT